MRRLAPAIACLLVIGCASVEPTGTVGGGASPPGAPLTTTPARFSDLPGWSDGRQDLSLAAFLATCPRLERRGDREPVGPAYAGLAGPWKRACAAAEDVPPGDAAAARAFFEQRFAPVALSAEGAATGLTTAYYEPEIQVSHAQAWPYLEPLLKRPANLEVVEAPDPSNYAGVRQDVFLRSASGSLSLAPPRGAIRRDFRPEDAIAYGKFSDVVFLQIQGSGRLIFPDGSRERAAFAATNGRPYSSIARHLANAGAFPIERASNDNIKAWLDQANREDADRIIDMNERYVWFGAEPLSANPLGPRGAAGVPLTDGASIAVDPQWHAYGVLFWIEPEGDAAPDPRLAVAQDTGGAITGPLRADLFFGSGEPAGAAASRVRHQSRWWALVPAP